MIGFKMMAAGLTAAFLVSSPPAVASVCRDTCNDQHLTCQTAGKAEGDCLAAWHQCKNRCDTPTLQKTSTLQTPAPPKTKPKKPH